ncbi:unnamed protein product [Thelazia callipaeda]|uniref:Tubulin polyglutamylase TTLL4 n=1 Tax=Thelazia callipaeda TaxID=103827 RepID=A0A0N5D495_THECL|nr:unnamed protein product [Thelazia callipaeda]
MQWGLENYLSHVIKIFEKLGYKLHIGTIPGNATFDVLWSHEYPFFDPLLKTYLSKLKPYQKVNHIPGSGYYTNKVSLATAGLTTGVPKAFDLPAKQKELLNYVTAYPEKLWVKKNNGHRGIRIQNISEIDFSDKDSFVQEFISNPFLIDNRKFDIGIYTVITSVSPLRVYIFEGDVLLRFCPKDYEPFDKDDVDKYVIGDNYTPVWKIKSLKKYYLEQHMTFQETLNAYIEKAGKDPRLIWNRIKETIALVFESQQSQMLAAGGKFVDKRPFFELSRFDFMLDEEMNVYLMEANMSPNLSSEHFWRNRLLYEQVIMNLFSLVGIASNQHGMSIEDRFADKETREMFVSDRDLRVFGNDCTTNTSQCFGSEGCKRKLKCQLCGHCLNYNLRTILQSTYEEHMSRRNMRRILPRSIHKPEHTGLPHSHLDRLLILWFDAKCKHDKTWCL